MEINLNIKVDDKELRQVLRLLGRPQEEVDYAIKTYFTNDAQVDYSLIKDRDMRMFALQGWVANLLIVLSEIDDATRPKIITLNDQ